MRNGQLLKKAYAEIAGHVGSISTMLTTRRISYTKVQSAAAAFEKAAKILREIN